ncbi:peroxisomal membrane protein 4 [Sporothrix schenckii 1099-18]|uniref:Peroxisomal membrane protein 4 n=1 Tax=Sporothrix schenckii 1099-18 TaxID=1397361 RepID=A0A0F2M804_SPOSC|nr:peroxisomal membrane protein 4 [Sporothrix schenckii 1099-18]KJR85214.1 peroxisomal membrane protein 4 [Sporothrix schenckii 1099-18]
MSVPSQLASTLDGLKAVAEQIVLDPKYHDLLAIVKGARNGAVYGAKVRFPHALVYELSPFYPLDAQRTTPALSPFARNDDRWSSFSGPERTSTSWSPRLFSFPHVFTHTLLSPDWTPFVYPSASPTNSLTLFSVREKVSLVLRATKHHASNLARFAIIYKTTCMVLKYLADGKEGTYDSFIGGLLGGYIVFGGRSKRSGKISSINMQIVIYVFARVVLALAKLAVKPGVGLPLVSQPPLSQTISYYAWPAFAAGSWAMVMHLFRYHDAEIQSSLRNSMSYIYVQSDHWDSLRTLLWHNK